MGHIILPQVKPQDFMAISSSLWQSTVVTHLTLQQYTQQNISKVVTSVRSLKLNMHGLHKTGS